MSWMLPPRYSGKPLITNPDRFFAELSGRESNLLMPFLLVLIGAVISAISAAMKFYCYGAASTGITVGLVAPFICWFMFAGIFYAIAIFSGEVGSFKRVSESGYGFIPKIPCDPYCPTPTCTPAAPRITPPIHDVCDRQHHLTLLAPECCYMGICSQARTQSIN